MFRFALSLALVAVGFGFCAEDASAQRLRGRVGLRAGRLARNVAFRGVRRTSALFVPFGANYVNQAPVVVPQPPVIVQQTTTYAQPAPVIVQQAVAGCANDTCAGGVGAAFVRNRGFAVRFHR